jgi:hypothetical protein
MESVPGSDAAAPRPMTTRATMSVSAFGASAARADPAQKTATPASMTFLRPKRSPSVPKVSMKLAKTSA